MAVPGDIVGTLFNAYGYKEQQRRLDRQFDQAQQNIDETQQLVADRTAFRPYTMRNSTGRTRFGPNGMQQELAPQYQQFMDAAHAFGGRGMLQALGPVDQREADIYDRLMAVQQPGLDRQHSRMQNANYAAGRAGMFTNQYGGSPEQHAMAMAQLEAQNQAAVSAMSQARDEQKQNFMLSSQLFDQGWSPQDQMRKDQALGLNDKQLNQHGDLNAARLNAELSLGESGMILNKANIDARNWQNFVTATTPALTRTADAGYGWLDRILRGL